MPLYKLHVPVSTVAPFSGEVMDDFKVGLLIKTLDVLGYNSIRRRVDNEPGYRWISTERPLDGTGQKLVEAFDFGIADVRDFTKDYSE